MGNPSAFIEKKREMPTKRKPDERVKDWEEFYLPFPEDKLRDQAARCMDCGVPFCNQGCPLGNLIPDWNDLVYRNHWEEAIKALHKTNNFPEFTGKICPAPCEGSCVLAINDDPVTIKQVELEIIDRAWKEGWIKPNPPLQRTGKRVAVIGSGPAGLAAADQLNKVGHTVTVFERAPRAGGLLTFGIPDFKMHKSMVDRRLNLLEEEGIIFRCGVNIGVDVSMEELQGEFDAIVVAVGATAPRDLNIPGREFEGIHFAMDYLTPANHEVYGDRPEDVPLIDARGKDVVIVGGGDTGADCYGTALRQKAKSVTQLQYNMIPPMERAWYNPWPEWPMTLQVSPAHEEGGERKYSVLTKRFVEDEKGNVKGIELVELKWTDGPKVQRKFEEVAGSEFVIPADLVLLAIGYTGPEKHGPLEQLELDLDRRGNVKTDENYMTSAEGVFAAGDARRGQSLVVWAIAEGRKAARGVDVFLMGRSDLPG